MAFPLRADGPDHGPGGHGFAGLYTNRLQMSVQRRDPVPVVEDDRVPVPAHPVPGVGRDPRRRGEDRRPGGREDVDPRVASPGPIPEAGGNGPGNGPRKKPDPVEPILRDAVPRGGPRTRRAARRAGARAIRTAARSIGGTRTSRRGGRRRHPPRTSDIGSGLPRVVTRSQLLFVAAPDRQDDDPALRQLVDPGGGDGRRRRGGQDAVERRVLGRPERAVPDDERHVRRSPSLAEAPPRASGEGREPLDRHELAAEAREDRRLVSRTGPDLEDLLRARSAGARPSSRRRCTAGRSSALPRWGEVRPRTPWCRISFGTKRWRGHLLHRRKDALVADSPAADLFLHHAAAEDGFLHQVHFRKARRAA